MSVLIKNAHIEGHLPDPVEDLSRGVRLDVSATRHHDKTDCQREDHQSETLWATPNVQDFCQRQLDQTAYNTGHDGSSRSERVQLESTGYIGRESKADLLLRGFDEKDHENPSTVSIR